MNEHYESKYHELEQNHFWFKARRDAIARLIGSFGKNSKILDVGCSIGTTIKFLNEKGYNNVYGIDISKKAVAACRRDGLKNVFVMDAAKMRFSSNNFDMIIASDVVEHVEDEDKIAREFNRVLSPGGALLVFVPAFKFLWTEGDDDSSHFKRYTKSDLKDVLERNRFSIERISYWNFGLFCPFCGMKMMKKLGPGIKKYPLHKMNAAVNSLALSLLTAENWVLQQKINFPWGISVFAIARKK